MPLKNKLTFPLNLSGSSLYLETKKIKTKSIVVSFTGAIGWREELLLEIVEKTVSKKKDIVFLFVCLTSKHMFSIKKIKEMAEENFLLKHIHFFFNQPYNKVPDILKYSDLGLSLIPPEQKFIVSSPSKLVDYMSLGIPVICNEEILEQKEIIQHTQGGVLVKYNSNEVSKAILDLVQNKNKMAEMGKKAKKWIYENRTFEKSSLAMEKVYEKVISRKE